MNRFLFSNEIKYNIAMGVFTGSAYSSYKICILLHCSCSDKAPTCMSPKRVLNVDLSYLPKCTEFVIDFRKSEGFQKFRLNRL